MYFVVGLGNPGLQYDLTRHNIGFEAVDCFAKDNGIIFNMKKHKAIIGNGIVGGKKVIVVKPQTYMNLSGECIHELLSFYKEDAKSLIVIYDDTSLQLGKMRIRSKGSSGGHNGIKSIIQHLGHDEFTRIKLGIGEKPQGWDLADYVLSRFNKDEIPLVNEIVEQASKAVEMLIDEGVYSSMNAFN